MSTADVAASNLTSSTGQVPISKPSMVPAPRVPEGVPESAHILVADDDPEIAEALSEYLQQKEGYAVSVVTNGQEAIDFLESMALEHIEIDLVLLDMRMPVLSGLEVLAWIRKHPQLRFMRVVLLTAASGSNEKVQALSAGADDYITKPYYPRELLARVKTILRTQQLEKQLQRQSQQLADLNLVGQKVAANLETSDVVVTAVEGVDAIFGVELAAVLMLEGGKLRYRQLHSKEGLLPIEQCPALSVDQGLTGLVYREQTAVYLNEPDADPRFQREYDAPLFLDTRSMMLAPLVVRGRSVGILAAFNKDDGPFNAVELDIFASLSSSVSEAIENAWLFQRIRMRQHELLESRNTLQALIDGIPDPIYTINRDWNLVSVNKSKQDELENIAEGVDSQTCYRALYGRETPCEHCLVAHTLTDKTAQHWIVNWIGPDHLQREWDVSAYPIPSKQSGSARAVVVWQDRTEERRLENSLLQAGKLAAIGRLAAGVAHEINNPLTAVNANAQLLQMALSDDPDHSEALELISRAGERAAKVVRGLLDFARQEQYAFTSGDVNATLEQALDLVRYQLEASNIVVALNLEDGLPNVFASREHLKSVWLNLLVNARDAVQELDRTRRIEVTSRLGRSGDHIQVLIRDNGKGMSQAEVEHIFEPFYTTKDPGKGTGLGLATCHRIIEQHGGEINLVSAAGQGTTFIVRLPVEEESAGLATSSPS
jgi:two-component system NtrC family sensor kinase